jgi:hypothetical protein
LTDTNEQVAMGRWVDRAYGKYGKFSPSERAAIDYYTPFVAWSLNAVRFIERAAERPSGRDSRSASATNASQQWLQDHGLYMWADNHAPAWLQGTIPLSGGGSCRRAGTRRSVRSATRPAPSRACVPPVLVGVDGAPRARLEGRPAHRQVRRRPVGGQEGRGRARSVLRLHDPCRRPDPAGRVEEGSAGQKLARQFDPFYPIQPTKKTAKGSSSKSSGDPVLDSFDKFHGTGGSGDPTLKDFDNWKKRGGG